MATDIDAFLDAPDKIDAFLDAPTPSTPTAKAPTRKEVYATVADNQGFFENLLAGAGGAVEGWRLGLKQLLGRAPTNDEVKEYQDAVAGLRGTWGGTIGEIGANIAPGVALTRAVTAPATVAGMMAKGGVPGALANVGIGSATGALEAGVNPVTEDQSRIENIGKGGLFGGVGAAGTGLLTKAFGLVKNATMPYFSKESAKVAGGKILQDVSGETSGDVIRALRAARPSATGAAPTAGQAVVGAGVDAPQFVATQAALEKMYPSNVLAQQQAARQATLQSFAGDEVALKAAINTRTANAAANYGKALNQAVKGDNELGSILRDPYVKDTFPDIVKLVQAKQAAGESVPLAQQLQMIKKELDKTLAGTPLNKPSDNQTRAVAAIQSKLEDWMTKKIPGYAEASTEFAKESGDILQMRVGQKLQDVLDPNLGTKERAAMFAKTVADETQLLKKTGGFTRSDLEAQMKPENMAKINAVIDDLNIDTNFNEQVKRGISGKEVQKAFGKNIDLPNLMNSAVAIANNATRKLTGRAKEKTLGELAVILRDPKATADIMEKATQREKNAIKFLMRSMQTGAIGGAALTEAQLQ